MNKIKLYLDELFPNPTCELIYHKDYELLIAVVLSAQTTDKKVNKVTSVLFDKYRSLEALKGAELIDLRTILKPLGMYQKKAIYVKEIATHLIERFNGRVENDRKSLESLSGVGRKTANVVLAVLFNEPCIAVDTHVDRVSKRLGLAENSDNVLQVEKKLTKLFDKNDLERLHYQLVLFGRYHCKAVKPNCQNCKLIKDCKYRKKHI